MNWFSMLWVPHVINLMSSNIDLQQSVLQEMLYDCPLVVRV